MRRRAGGLHLHSLRFVHAAPGARAYLFEAVAVRGAAAPGGPAVLPPLHVRGADGRYTPEAARRVAGAALPGGAPPSEEAVAAVRERSRTRPRQDAADAAAAAAAG